MTEQTYRVPAADPRVKGIIRHIFPPEESEILRGALAAQQFILQSSCEPSKSTLGTNNAIAFSSESLQYGLQKPSGGHRCHVASQRIPRIMYTNDGRFPI